MIPRSREKDLTLLITSRPRFAAGHEFPKIGSILKTGSLRSTPEHKALGVIFGNCPHAQNEPNGGLLEINSYSMNCPKYALTCKL